MKPEKEYKKPKEDKYFEEGKRHVKTKRRVDHAGKHYLDYIEFKDGKNMRMA